MNTNNSLENEQQDDLREWVMWSMVLSVVAMVVSALTWIFKR